MEKLKESHKFQDLAAIETAMEGLNKAWEGAAQEMYAASGGAQAGGPEGAQVGGSSPSADASTGSESDVSDAEHEEVNDKESKS